MPGNEMNFFVGYGTDLKFIGRTVIRKVRPHFPREEIPSMEVIGYTADSKMMDDSPEEDDETGEETDEETDEGLD